MNKRNAVGISVTFHAVLLTALGLYLTIWDKAPPQSPPVDDTAPPVAWFDPPPEQEEPPEDQDPPPPVRTTENVPEDAETLPFQSNDTKDFAGPIVEESLMSPPPATPSPISRTPPDYPADCLRDGDSGKVEAILTINPDGRVVDIEVISATKACFAREAEKALRKWRYERELVTEIATNSARKARVEVVFNLEDVKRRR
jgi:protein TonB